jgi:hypothetical protein
MLVAKTRRGRLVRAVRPTHSRCNKHRPRGRDAGKYRYRRSRMPPCVRRDGHSTRARPDSGIRSDRRTGMKVVARAVVILAAVSTGIAAGSGTHSVPPAPSDVYLGVACHTSDTNCGRVGVAVWLPRTADVVTARVLGSAVWLTTTHSGSGRYGFRRYWTGFHRFPARRVHPGSLARVRITVVLGGRSRAYVRSTYLSAGWG